MLKAAKKAVAAELHQLLEGTYLVVVTRPTGMSVAELTELRRRLRGAGARLRVTKNTLARRAVGGTKFAGLAALFAGPTAIAYSEDPVAAAKVAVQFAKENEKLVIVGGALGERVLGLSEVKALATLPSLDQLRGKLAGLLVAPAGRLAALLKAPQGSVARVIAAYGSKGGPS